MLEKTIVALDFPDLSSTKDFVSKVSKEIFRVKVGMELFYSEGFEVLEFLKEHDLKIFLDLKLHDIPTTVSRALKVIDSFDLEFVNVHALGGVEMMSKAQESLSSTKLLAVTILTSHDQHSLQRLGLEKSLDEYVEKFHMSAYQSGLSGIVCSGLDLKTLKKIEGFEYITPGVRMNKTIDDQKRVLTPWEAFKNGATYVVMGREITRSIDPLMVIEKLKDEYERNS